MHLLLIAILPAALLMFVICKCDRVEPEPVSLIFKVMGLGMLTVFPSIICEMIGGAFVELYAEIARQRETAIYFALENFLVIGLAEEFWKLFVVKKYIWKKKEFNYRFDAIVYCVASSLGFALLENIMYVFQYGFMTGVMRAVLSVPGHCTFAVFMGFFLGDAKLYEARGNMKKKKQMLLLALIAPMLVHGFYDFCLSMQEPILTLVFLLFVIICDAVAIVRIIRSEKQDVSFYALQAGDQWLENQEWLYMAASTLEMEMPDRQKKEGAL